MANYVVRPKSPSPLRGTDLVVQEIWVNSAEESCRIRLIGSGDLPADVAREVEEKLNLTSVTWEKNGVPILFANP